MCTEQHQKESHFNTGPFTMYSLANLRMGYLKWSRRKRNKALKRARVDIKAFVSEERFFFNEKGRRKKAHLKMKGERGAA